jgi:hypothetical protein
MMPVNDYIRNLKKVLLLSQLIPRQATQLPPHIRFKKGEIKLK